MTWYTEITAMCLLLYQLTLWSKGFAFMFGIGFNGSFMTGALCTDGVTVTALLAMLAT
jgi:hypothetical protein